MQITRQGLVAVWVAGALHCGGEPSNTSDGSSSTGDGSSGTSTTGEPITTGAPTSEPTTAGPSGPDTDPTTGATSTGDTSTTGTLTESAESGDTIVTGTDESSGTTSEEPPGPIVDVSDPQLYDFSFTPDQADPEAKLVLGKQMAQLDTTVTPLGKLVVYLHGAGDPSTCGSHAHGVVLAKMGFHVVQPCYLSGYGVGNCDDDIGGCRLEAFEGVDHHDFIDVKPPDSIETRVVKALEYLQAEHPGGDWQYFIVDGKPRWSQIIVSGISHGASTSGLIGTVREVDRAVMLSGPLDSNQAWLKVPPVTPIDRFYGFTHTDDDQHPGHLKSFGDMMLPGEPAMVDGAEPPYGDSHRLVSSAQTDNGHNSTQAGGSSPKEGDAYVFLPVWQTMYGTLP